ncbi:hypothetical protein [Pseudoruegeria sp. HB172150]|uniref:hypothetical protein n=1 Tax=Pseudoruegeria sp. HB172150 TaxID=2721164 RepID=UPI001555B1E8|nr:hypothetical protein [Pseudoruegeria sp. HB172150]
MTRFDIDALRALISDGVRTHGLRGYARNLGVGIGAIRSVLDGRDPQLSKLQELISATGHELSWGAADTSERSTQGFIADLVDQMNSPTSVPEVTSSLMDGYLPVPWHQQNTKAGKPPLAFSIDWLISLGIDPRGLRLAGLCEDLGEEENRTVALVDSAANKLGGPARWCWVEDEKIVAGTLFWDEGGPLVVMPDRPGDQPRVLLRASREQLNILGRVVWIGTLEPS